MNDPTNLRRLAIANARAEFGGSDLAEKIVNECMTATVNTVAGVFEKMPPDTLMTAAEVGNLIRSSIPAAPEPQSIRA